MSNQPSLPPDDHPAWATCTWEGAEDANLQAAAKMSFFEMLQWQEEVQELSLRFAAAREAMKRPDLYRSS